MSLLRVSPIVLAFPQVYDRLTGRFSHPSELQGSIAKCFELAKSRPTDPNERHGGYMGLDEHHALFTVWSCQADVPDIFVLAGWGDGFGPGHSCPDEAALQAGDYGQLIRVPFLI